MERPFEVDEVRAAVFECSKERAHGPSGFTMSLFQECWKVVKDDFMKVFDEFFS